MVKNSFRQLRNSKGEASVTVEDVQRIRRQRRHAQTAEEYTRVRMYMRDLVGDLTGRPRSNEAYLKSIGIALIAIGFVVGIVLFYVAYNIWPLYLEFMGS